MQEEPMEENKYPLTHSAACAGSTMVTMGLLDVLAHLGPTGLLVGGLASYVAWKHGPELYEYVRQKFPAAPAPGDEDAEPTEQQPPTRRKRSVLDRALGRFPAEEQAAEEPDEDERDEEPAPKEAQEEEVSFDLDGDEDLLRPSLTRGVFCFSSVLERFQPNLERIFLARTATGLDLCCTARDLCHVALAGNTGGGKSSIMRLLMLQLCAIRVRVLLLNPHYTRYDLDTNEDWTPFEPYLVHPPMECRRYEVIAHYLKSIAKDLIPKRLERRAHSQPVGKPYFIVIDELPSIVREIEAAPEYLRVILEEGRKVGVFLISAAHDFLVKTISPKAGGGSIRECYRTAYYVGGDPTTARTLLDMPASLIPEDALGKGVVMLRGVPAKKAMQVYVPYVENASLYRLLGPSTYRASGSVSVPEVDFPPVPPVYGAIHNKQVDKHGVYSGVNAPVEPSDGTIEGAFTDALINENPQGQKTERAPVNEDIRKHMRRMHDLGYPHREISKIVGLYGPKYALYKRVCAEEGIKIEKES